MKPPVSFPLLVVIAVLLAITSWFLIPDRSSSGTRTISTEIPPSSRTEPSADKLPPTSSATGAPYGKASPPTGHPSLPVFSDFIRTLSGTADQISFMLPDGREFHGVIESRTPDDKDTPSFVDGRVIKPTAGRFLFQVDPNKGRTPEPLGIVVLQGEPMAYKVMKEAPGDWVLKALPAGKVICLMPPVDRSRLSAEEKAAAPSAAAALNTPIVSLESLPGAAVVLYLDFDGETDHLPGWGDFDVAAFDLTDEQITDVWKQVAEDFAPFKINVTTDLQVFLAAAVTSRQRCIVTPTTTPQPGAGGVAYLGSLTWANDTPCFAFYGAGKESAEVISHELGHTLGLYHDGRSIPWEEYYWGHGSHPVSWAPIMGASYYTNLTHWSRGEYNGANNGQDDTATIAGIAGFRTDLAGGSHATSAPLVFSNPGLPTRVVATSGIIEHPGDIDAYRFSLPQGGLINLKFSPASANPNLDIAASLYNSSDVLIASSNPDRAIDANIIADLPPGNYTVRVDGTGRGLALEDGYSDYGSLGQFQITGSVTPASSDPATFTVADTTGNQIYRTTAQNTTAGQITAVKSDPTTKVTFAITGGNGSGIFGIDATTGRIFVANSTALADTGVSSFLLTISATDDGSPVYTTTCTASIVVIPPPAATVTLGNLNQVFDGSPKSVSVTTFPASLSFTVTYNGSSAPPTAIGSYAVTATVNDSFYIGSSTGTLIISPGKDIITWRHITPGSGTDLNGNNDGDRLNDLLEYALASDPASGVPVVIGSQGVRPGITAGLRPLLDDNGILIGLAYTRPRDRTDLTYELQISDDLVNWHDIGGPLPVPNLNEDDLYLETLSYDINQSYGSARLKITHSSGTSAYSPIFAWSTSTLEGPVQSLGLNLVKPSVFSGTVDYLSVFTNSGTGFKLVVSGSSTRNPASLFLPGKSYYLELTSGSAAGTRIDIYASGSELHINGAESASNSINIFPAELYGSSFLVREHDTLADLAPKTSFTGNTNLASADQIQFMVNGAFTTYYLLDARPAVPAYYYWAKSGGIVNSNGLIVPPGTGVFVTRPANAPIRQVPQSGELRLNPFRQVFKRPGYSIVTGGFPVSESPADRAMNPSSGFKGTANFSTADKLHLLKGDRSPGILGYTSYYLLDGGTPAYRFWTLQGQIINSTNSLLLESNRAQLLELKGNSARFETVTPPPFSP